MELSPGSIRTFVVGTAYQMGNLASSASSTIESQIGERFPLESSGGTTSSKYDYGKVICIFMGCVFGYTILVTLLGPENMGQEFDAHHDEDLMDVAADNALHKLEANDDAEKVQPGRAVENV